MLIIDPARPVSTGTVLQRLRLTDSLVTVASHVVEEQGDPLESFAMLTLPPDVVCPHILGPDGRHAATSCDDLVLYPGLGLRLFE